MADIQRAARRPTPRGRRLLTVALASGVGLGLLLSGYLSLRQELVRQARRIEEMDQRLARLERASLSGFSGPSGEAATVPARIYFTRAGAQGAVELVAVTRPIPADMGPVAPLERVMQELLRGPQPDRGEPPDVLTQIPEGTRLLGVRLEGPTAYLDFSRELEQTAGTMRLEGILRQIVFTATEVPSVERVVLLVEGERTGTDEHPFTGDGLLFGELTRERLPL